VSISSSVLHHECGIELTEKFYKALFSLFTPQEVTIKQKMEIPVLALHSSLLQK